MENIPLYQQIVIALKTKIESEELKAGDQLPTEAELSKAYEVSRITSKRALTELENANLIYRIQGKGSFVASKIHNNRTPVKADNKILLILPFSHNSALGDYEQGINEYLAGTEYTIIIQSNTFADQGKRLQAALQSSYSGVIFYPVNSTSDLGILYQYHLSQFPLVTMDKRIEGIPILSVVSDNFDGAYQATKYLIERNHKKIAFISSLKFSSTIRERYLGYLQALYECNLLDHSLNEVTERYLLDDDNKGRAYYLRFIQNMKDRGITAVVSENDLIAIELIQMAKEQGLSIPDDFSIVGFDNIHLANFVEPKLTTISQDFGRVGYLAAQNLVQLIQHPLQQPIDNVIVPVKLIERETVRKL